MNRKDKRVRWDCDSCGYAFVGSPDRTDARRKSHTPEACANYKVWTAEQT